MVIPVMLNNVQSPRLMAQNEQTCWSSDCTLCFPIALIHSMYFIVGLIMASLRSKFNQTNTNVP